MKHTVYRKMYKWTGSLTNTQSTSVNTGITNFGELISLSGYGAVPTAGSWRFRMLSGLEIAGGGTSVTTLAAHLAPDGSKIHLVCYGVVAFTSAFITLEYTKSV